ncbi:hypothetical protein [Streptomyces galilaeus]|uniref:hypothetical protein n=1 Tax=Streptomyces galilaeus TaxID=33899 RepID=UPI0038F62393
MTHTRVHTYITFANPHLVCEQCRQPATRWHDRHKCGCDTRSWIDPCGHNAEAVSVCPSWSPLDGCLCQEFLGRVDHAPAPTPA